MKRIGFKQKTFSEQIAIKKKAKPKKTVKKKTKSVSSYKGIPNTKRWKGNDGWRGMYWTILSMYTRKRDFLKYGKCVSCRSTPEQWRDWDAGHYVSVSNGNAETCYLETNIHGQCKKCNNPKWTPDSSIPFREELLKRIGKKELMRIEKIRSSQLASKQPTTKDFEELTEKIYIKYNKLP